MENTFCIQILHDLTNYILYSWLNKRIWIQRIKFNIFIKTKKIQKNINVHYIWLFSDIFFVQNIYSGTLQEPQSSAVLLLSDDVSNEEENFADLSFSFSTPLMSIIQRENSKEIMRFSSSTAAANHSVDSSSTPSFANNYINLDLTIWICLLISNSFYLLTRAQHYNYMLTF